MTAARNDSSPRRRGPSRPSSRRRRAHQALPAKPPEKVALDHPLVPQGAPQWIDQDEPLAEALEHVRQAGCCAYDTEFIGEETYYPNLCLIQLATAERIFVIDGRAGLDLTGLWAMLADAAVVKIVHAGEQDLEPVVRLWGKAPANVFDTQIAAGFAGLRYPVALSRLIRCLLGVTPPKGLTFTQWDERPMSAAHLQYAADDVRFGLALREALIERLDRLGHRSYAERAGAERCQPQRFGFNVEAVCERMRGAKSLEGRKPAILRSLVTWRDAAARQADLPPRTFCKDEVLMGLVRKPVRTIEQLNDVPFLSNYHKRHHGRDIFAAIAHGLQQPPRKRLRRKSGEPSAEMLFQIDKFWVAVMAYCYSRSVDPAVVTNRAQIAAIYLSANDGDEPVNLGSLASGWRDEFIGPWLRDYLAEHLGRTFQP